MDLDVVKIKTISYLLTFCDGFFDLIRTISIFFPVLFGTQHSCKPNMLMDRGSYLV